MTILLKQPGTYVTIGRVDMNGLQGRDKHPHRGLEGQRGIVTEAYAVENLAADENVMVLDPANALIVFYNVAMPDGRTYQFADYEFKEDPA